LTALDNARLARTAWKGKAFDLAASAAQYREAFAAFGIDLQTLSPANAAQALRSVPTPIRTALIAALDDWTWCERKDLQPRLRQAADGADDDDWRRRWRQAADNLDALQSLVADLPRQTLPAASFSLLALGLLRGGDRPGAVAVLQEGQRRYPMDFWINTDLGNYLPDPNQGPTRRKHDLTGMRRGVTRWEPKRGSGEGLVESIGCFRVAAAVRPQCAGAHSNLGLALYMVDDLPGAMAAYRRVLALDPNLANAHYNLALATQESGDLDQAIAELQLAVKLSPTNAGAHNDLGYAWFEQGHVAEALAEYRQAIALDPKHAMAHNNLGVALRRQGQITEAMAEYRTVIALDPDYAMGHYNLGVLLQRADMAGAIVEYRKTIALDPDYLPAHYNLGKVLLNQGDAASAIAAFNKALALNPEAAEVECNLGSALRRVGRFQEALAHVRRGDELGRHQKGWRYPSADWVKEAEQLAELDRHLASYVRGERHPRDGAESFRLAYICNRKKMFASSTRFYANGLQADPKQAAAKRYDAACNAALAAAGQGSDAADLKPEERTKLRLQALAWLRADLETLRERTTHGSPLELSQAAATLRHWQMDSDLAGLRDAAALQKLPPSERTDWQRLWTDLAALLKNESGSNTADAGTMR
jgi:tetratricopeptide (TPR) repeat protein